MTPSDRVFGSTVEVYRATLVPGSLGPSRTWTKITDVRARVRVPSALQVAALGRQPGQRRFLVAHLPHGSDVKPGDRLAWRGAQWEVSGVAEQERLAFLRVEAEEVV